VAILKIMPALNQNLLKKSIIFEHRTVKKVNLFDSHAHVIVSLYFSIALSRLYIHCQISSKSGLQYKIVSIQVVFFKPLFWARNCNITAIFSKPINKLNKLKLQKFWLYFMRFWVESITQNKKRKNKLTRVFILNWLSLHQ